MLPSYGFCQVKIADFGLACFDVAGENKTMEVGSYRWMAPEVLLREQYGYPADVYSYGIIMYEMLTRQVPFTGISPMKVRYPLLCFRGDSKRKRADRGDGQRVEFRIRIRAGRFLVCLLGAQTVSV